METDRMDEVIERLVGYVDGLSIADLDEKTIEAITVRVVDTVGCMIGGSGAPPGSIARRRAAQNTGTPAASVLGATGRSSLEYAVFANTTMARYLDFNDSNPGGGHFSDMIPAMMATAEACGASGTDLIVAIAAAYEVAGRLAAVTRIRLRGWDNASYINVATALAAGKLLGLSRRQLGHAASMAAISNLSTWASREGEVSMWKACASASANRHGIFTALLAADGMTGPAAPFTGRNGIEELITATPMAIDFTSDRPLSVTQSAIKTFPCQDDAQGPIELALSVRDRLDVNEIAAIRLDSYHIAYATDGSRVHPNKWDPRTREMADHSVPYLISIGLVDGVVNLDSFRSQRYLDPALRPLMEKVTIYQDSGYRSRYPAELNNTLTITLRSGEVLSEHVRHPHGHPDNPLSTAEIDAK
ncbi:MAG TPA: MmgE/PrpD family protein, partial [Micromonosporaceae bacterium]